ncbi:fibrillin-2-like [Saccostrea echinata]|uniref:fibrillin-2-like n=1 Tax=Saccostrea echinata TaxID=191078 RepID=UPI002A7EACF8|nr:fibrillin-2-like [Saccostrea echinata]
MFKYAECECDIGYSGQDCENDTDGCAQSPCAQGRDCTDLTPEEERLRGRGYSCSDCPAGYFLDVDKCEDKNECNSTTTNTCDSTTQDCENTEGSYQCNCKTGFRKVGDTCQDVDECIESTSGCEQSCTNTPGSFVCSCVTGFKLNSDKKSCNGSRNCIGLNCEYACSNATGSDICICRTGFKLKDEENCTDINECEVGGFCSQDCQNSVGTYTCSCFSGFSLNPDKTTCSACEPPSYGVDCKETCRCGKGMDRCDPVTGCVCKANWTGSNCDQDVNECTENPNICGSDKTCVNLEGGYTCNCRAGYKKDSQGNCGDINECDNAASNNCSTETTICSNNNGSYSCTCKSGYTRKNLYECEDFDECNAGTDGCTQKCENVDGSFNCECEFGYTLGDDRKTCIEVQDICSLFPSLNCTYGCKKNNTVGYCFCAAGYLLNAQDKRSCVDVDECNDVTLNNCNFKEKCVNTGGSYNCSCPTGYTLENDGRTCKECNGFTYGEDCKTPCNCGVGFSSCDNVKGCICDGGWTGEKCDIDKDECSAGSPCTKANQECKNTPGSYQCVCAVGYEKNTTSDECLDVDECKSNPCSQLCTNTLGSYSCGCNPGFRLVATSQCEDIDECSAPTSPCDQICTNTQGSFRCSCNPGFSLNTTTRTTCETRTRCENTTFNCTQKCGVNLDRSEYCFCDPGFSLNDDGFNCTDIDECSSNPCSENCTQNAVAGAGYTCSCADGKRLDVDNRTCIDCDSQKYGPGCTSDCTCDVQNTLSCNKVNGSCTCKKGWEGANCSIDIDECNSTETVCPTNAKCSNTNGSFSCICIPGFAMANGKCVECTSTTYGQDCANKCTCDITNSRSCDKQNGTCYCNDGWMGANCTEDIRECDNNQNICGANANCSEVPGSYACNCDPGYKKSTNGLCEDINECVLGKDTCDANADCTNTVGSFNCTCNVGFSGDGFSCTSCNNTHFGEECSSLCSCIEANTVDCDDVTGKCTCKTTWNGTNCDVDINECDLGTHNCNKTYQNCENNDGGFKCVCRYGESSGVCKGGCNDTHYGYQCNQTCPCDLTNTPNVDFPKGLEKFWNSMEFQTFPYKSLKVFLEVFGIFWNLNNKFGLRHFEVWKVVEFYGKADKMRNLDIFCSGKLWKIT